jgi:putative transposase
MTISNELLDELLKGCKRSEDLLGEAGLMKELKVRLMERMLGAELTTHLGYGAGAELPGGQTNRRNGTATKRVKGWRGAAFGAAQPPAVPRDLGLPSRPRPERSRRVRCRNGAPA